MSDEQKKLTGLDQWLNNGVTSNNYGVVRGRMEYLISKMSGTYTPSNETPAASLVIFLLLVLFVVFMNFIGGKIMEADAKANDTEDVSMIQQTPQPPVAMVAFSITDKPTAPKV